MAFRPEACEHLRSRCRSDDPADWFDISYGHSLSAAKLLDQNCR